MLLLKYHFASCEQFDHALIESRQIFRAAAADPGAIANQFLVYPVGTGIADVILDGVVTGHGLALDQARGNQQPGTMTDNGDGLALAVSLAHKLLCRWHHSQRVG